MSTHLYTLDLQMLKCWFFIHILTQSLQFKIIVMFLRLIILKLYIWKRLRK